MDVHSGLHTFLGDDPEFSAAAHAKGVQIVDFRRPPERHETAIGRPHAPGKRVILTVGTDCAIGKMSVALELRKSGLAQGDRVVFVPTGPDRDDDRRLGRGGRPRDQRLRPGHGRVDARGGRGARRLAHRRGPGLARPPGVLVGDARAHPWLDAARDGHGPQAGPRSTTTSTTAPDARFPIAKLPEFIRLHETVAGLVAPSKVVGGGAEHDALPVRRRGAAGHRRDRRRDRPPDRRSRAIRWGPAVARDPRGGRRPAVGARERLPMAAGAPRS